MKFFNKRARFDFQLLEKYEAGIVLTGGEAKAVRTGHLNLTGSYAKIIGGEGYLVNANIHITGAQNYDPTRSRKLLLHKKEIESIQSQIKAKKLTLVPVSMYTTHNLVKVELVLAKSKKKFEKKESIKKKDIARELERETRTK